MVERSNKKESVTLAPQVFALIAAHAASHPTSAVHGILVGSRNGDQVTIADAFPVCHENPTRTLVETALSLVQSIIEGKNQTIVGWFTAPELLHETKPGPVALRIVANLAAAMDSNGEGVPVLLVLNNQSILKLLTTDEKDSSMKASQTIQAFGKDFGMQWMEPIENLSIEDESRSTKAVMSMLKQENDSHVVNDLVDHWDQGATSEWTSASSLTTFANK